MNGICIPFEPHSIVICFNIQVPDPYAWLEDPDGEETQAFVEAQNKITMPYLEKCAHREKYKKRFVCMIEHE